MRKLVGMMVWSFSLIGSIAFFMNPVGLYADDPSSIPPLPIVYQGIVTVDGEIPTKEFVLTVRIGDWESKGVKVINGEKINRKDVSHKKKRIRRRKNISEKETQPKKSSQTIITKPATS